MNRRTFLAMLIPVVSTACVGFSPVITPLLPGELDQLSQSGGRALNQSLRARSDFNSRAMERHLEAHSRFMERARDRRLYRLKKARDRRKDRLKRARDRRRKRLGLG